MTKGPVGPFSFIAAMVSSLKVNLLEHHVFAQRSNPNGFVHRLVVCTLGSFCAHVYAATNRFARLAAVCCALANGKILPFNKGLVLFLQQTLRFDILTSKACL